VGTSGTVLNVCLYKNSYSSSSNSTIVSKAAATLAIEETAETVVGSDAITISTSGVYIVSCAVTSGSGQGFLRYVQLEAATDGQTAPTAWTESTQDALPEPDLFPQTSYTAGDKVTDKTRTGVSETVERVRGNGKNLIYAHVTNLKACETYTLSFWTKGGSVSVGMYVDSSTAACRGSIESAKTNATFNYGTQGTLVVPASSTTWHRVCVTFTMLSTIPSGVAFYIQSQDTGYHYATGYRIERGGRFTGNSVGQDALLATGIDIQNRSIVVTSDNFKIQNNAGVTTTTVDKDGNLTVAAVQTVDAGGSTAGSQTGHIIIRNGIISIFGFTRKLIEIGADPTQDVPYIEGYNTDGERVWRLDENGIKSYKGANSIQALDASTGYMERVADVTSPDNTVFGSDRLDDLTATASSTYTLTAAENAALIAGAQTPETYYKYVAGRDSSGTVVADTAYNLSAEEAADRDGCYFTLEYPTESNAVDEGRILYRIIPSITVGTDGSYTYLWQATIIEVGTSGFAYAKKTYYWQYSTAES